MSRALLRHAWVPENGTWPSAYFTDESLKAFPREDQVGLDVYWLEDVEDEGEKPL